VAKDTDTVRDVSRSSTSVSKIILKIMALFSAHNSTEHKSLVVNCAL
jgi:hypothetical protein